MIGGAYTYEIALEDCRVEGGSAGPGGPRVRAMQTRLGTRRIQMAAWSVGMAQRALDMSSSTPRSGKTFGTPLSERQAIQFWVAEAGPRSTLRG